MKQSSIIRLNKFGYQLLLDKSSENLKCSLEVVQLISLPNLEMTFILLQIDYCVSVTWTNCLVGLIRAIQRTLTYFVRGNTTVQADLLFDWFGFSCFVELKL